MTRFVSSGDVTRGVIAVAARAERSFISAPSATARSSPGSTCTFAPLETADYVVCSGLFDDETETPDDYRARLAAMLKRKLFMVCGNPDVVVERGDRLVYCAGAIADIYASMGGEVLYAGKPYRPIYDLALAKAEMRRGRKARTTPRAGDRRFGAHRSCRRARLSASIACSSPRAFTPRNWAGAGSPTRGAIKRPVRRRRRIAEGGDAAVGLVELTAPPAATMSGNTASILLLSVCALKGLTM